jgi:uncharacterized protein YebE (UPF0316 family)
MESLSFLNSDSEIFAWVVLPILIFIARICDQSIGTVRLIFVSKGFKFLAPLLGFFEVIIWLAAIGQIMKHLDNIVCYAAYGGGFAMGNYIGIYLEEKLSIGTVILRIIPRNEAAELIAYMKEKNFGITMVDAEGSMGKVKMIFSIVNRSDAKNVIGIINELSPEAFYSIEDVKSVSKGIFPKRKSGVFNSISSLNRKGK